MDGFQIGKEVGALSERLARLEQAKPTPLIVGLDPTAMLLPKKQVPAHAIDGWEHLYLSTWPGPTPSFECEFRKASGAQPVVFRVMETFTALVTTDGVHIARYHWTVSPPIDPTHLVFSADSDPAGNAECHFLVQGLQNGDVFRIRALTGEISALRLRWVNRGDALVINQSHIGTTYTAFSLIFQ